MGIQLRPPSQEGQSPPNFRPVFIVAKRPHISAAAEHLFVQLTILPNPQNPALYNALSQPHIPKVPLRVGHLHPSQYPRLHLNLFSCFCTAHDEESLYNAR